MVSNQAVFPSSHGWDLQTSLRTDILLLFQAAMVVFVITVRYLRPPVCAGFPQR